MPKTTTMILSYVSGHPTLSSTFPRKVYMTLITFVKQVQATPVKRLCKTRNAITVNGMFPGPTLEVNNGDTLVVNVVNRAQYNVTIHW